MSRYLHRQPLHMPGGWKGWWLSDGNVFRGWRGAAWELDDWGHRRLSRRLHRIVLGALCDHLDRQLWPKENLPKPGG